MKKILLLIIPLLLAFSSRAQVEGNVMDTSRKAIPGAVIIMIDSVKNTTDSVKSNKQGFYAFKGLKKGIYKIVARATGYVDSPPEIVIIENENTDDDHTGSDISNATWIEIILRPARPRKQ